MSCDFALQELDALVEEKSGPLPALAATATISRSTMPAARLMMSMWPLVTGSNVPG